MTLSKSDSQIIESPFWGEIFAQCFKSTSIQQYQYIWYSGFNTHILKKYFYAVTSKLSGSENSLKPVVLLCSILAQSRFSFTISIKSQDFEFALPLPLESTKAQTKRKRDEAYPTTRGKRKRRLLKNKSDTLIAVKLPTVYIEGA